MSAFMPAIKYMRFSLKNTINGTLFKASGTPFSLININVNNLYDWFTGATNEFANGYQQWANFYNRYLVTGFKIRLKVLNVGVAGYFFAGMGPNPIAEINPTDTWLQVRQYSNCPGMCNTLLDPGNGGTTRPFTYKRYYSFRKHFRLTDFDTNPDYSGSYSTQIVPPIPGPVKQFHFQYGTMCVESTLIADITSVIDMKLTMYAKLTERTILLG